MLQVSELASSNNIITYLFFMKEHDGALSFQTDAWTSPNFKAYVAVTVTFEFKGVQYTMLLDIVEVAKSHSGINLAAAFAKILEYFGISDKVSCTFNDSWIIELTRPHRSSASHAITHRITIQ